MGNAATLRRKARGLSEEELPTPVEPEPKPEPELDALGRITGRCDDIEDRLACIEHKAREFDALTQRVITIENSIFESETTTTEEATDAES